MIYLIFFLIVASMFHLVWESILAPSIRLGLRYELFRLRDELRWLHYNDSSNCNHLVFKYLQGSLNNGIRLLPRTDFVMFSTVERAIANDEGLRKRIEKRRESIDACNNDDVQRIERRIENITRRAFAVNTGGWMIYVVPIFCAFACFGAVNRFIKEALLVPEGEMEQIIPDGVNMARHQL